MQARVFFCILCITVNGAKERPILFAVSHQYEMVEADAGRWTDFAIPAMMRCKFFGSLSLSDLRSAERPSRLLWRANHRNARWPLTSRHPPVGIFALTPPTTFTGRHG
jgi:hypothetical protein